jgi:hypothetical protein
MDPFAEAVVENAEVAAGHRAACSFFDIYPPCRKSKGQNPKEESDFVVEREHDAAFIKRI